MSEKVLVPKQDLNLQDKLLSHILEAPIRWNLEYGNSVEMVIVTDIDFGEWDNKVYDYYTKPTCHYISWSGDGRAEIHYHTQLREPDENGVWVTSQDRGYAGRGFNITMSDGRKACLRGPWHGTAPEDYKLQDISYRNIHSKYDTYTFGVKITQDLWRRIAHKFHPEIPVIESKYGLTFDKAYADQTAVDKFLELQKTETRRNFALKRLKDLGIQYA